MSEIDIILKQFEFCINLGHFKAASVCIRELVVHKAKINLTVSMNFQCVSHDYLFSKEYSSNIKENFEIFQPCLHSVCFNCIETYIRSIYDRVKLQYTYVCPGCLVKLNENPTPLQPSQLYFTRVISVLEQDLSLHESETTIQTIIKANHHEHIKPSCYFYNNKIQEFDCTGNFETETIPRCNHKVCRGCIDTSLSLSNKKPPFSCFVPKCNKKLSDYYIRSLLVNGSNNFFEIISNLRIEGLRIIICPFCINKIETESYLDEIICPRCEKEFCSKCREYSHEGMICEDAKLDEKQSKLIECLENDIIPEYRSFYTDACVLFEWKLEPKVKEELKKKYNIQFRVKKVFKVMNPRLNELYRKHKANLEANKIDPNEKWVFHGTRDEFYNEICLNGFKIGGVDIKINKGNTYGFGVYTATDATMSIVYYNNKKIIICKGLAGIESAKPIENPNELKTTKCHSYLADHKGKRSNFFVFFNKEYVLPYYLIEYE